MAPNPRIAKAFRAMRDIGIPEEKVKPVLKNLLKLYEKNWELIEVENYRALADAIFEQEEGQVPVPKKRNANAEQEEMAEAAEVHEEPERPLKRLRLRHQENHVSTSSACSSPMHSRPTVDRDIVVLPKHRNENSHTLIKPKDEPLALAQFEVPIAAIHPEPPITDHFSSRNGLIGEAEVPKTLSFCSLDGEERNDGVPFSPSRRRINGAVANIADESSSTLEIASSSFGDMKISMSCKNPHGGPDFHMPSLEAVFKMMEDKCLRSYKVLDPSFSVINIMKEMCECALELGTRSAKEPQETKDATPAADLFGKSNALDVVVATEKPLGPNVSVDSQHGAQTDQPEILSLPPYSEGASHNSENKNDIPEIRINATPAAVLLGKYNALDAVVASEKPLSPNVSVHSLHGAQTDQPEILSLPPYSEGVSHSSENKNDIPKSRCAVSKEKEQIDLGTANFQNLVVAQQLELMPLDARAFHDVNDIAKGQEMVIISLVNEVNDEHPPAFYYISCNVVSHNACVNFSLARIGDKCCFTCFGDCLSSSQPCACAHETSGDFAYTLEGLIKEDFLEECISMNRDSQKQALFYCKECPLERSKKESQGGCKGHLEKKFIKECWWKCGCSKQCGNRVVQRGINYNLQVFMTTEGKGWGLRTLEDLPKGAFVCEYVGEILTMKEFYERVSQSSNNKKPANPVLLDAIWGTRFLKDEETLCLDATSYSNIARFINHRCFDSNLIGIPVEMETPEHHYYHLALFTTRKVEALEELTWDYGIGFDEHDNPFRTFKCLCDSKFCRNIKHFSKKVPLPIEYIRTDSQPSLRRSPRIRKNLI